MIRFVPLVWLFLFASFLSVIPARADVLHLDTGSTQECVIIKITDKRVMYETELGRATLPRSKVVAVTREPDETNEQLLKRWRAAQAAESARARARKRDAQVERLRHEALGEVFYRGEWMTAQEKAARVEAERRAREAAARLDREETAAGNRFAYGVWWTPDAHAQLREKEQELQARTRQMRDLQERLNLKTDQIENLRLRMLQESDLDELDKSAKQIDGLQKDRAELSVEMDGVKAEGDRIAAEVQQLTAQQRARLEAVLTARGEPVESLDLLRGP